MAGNIPEIEPTNMGSGFTTIVRDRSVRSCRPGNRIVHPITGEYMSGFAFLVEVADAKREHGQWPAPTPAAEQPITEMPVPNTDEQIGGVALQFMQVAPLPESETPTP